MVKIRKVTVVSGEGKVYDGLLKYRVGERDITKLPQTKTEVMMNMSVPEGVLLHAQKADGIGLMRLEFVIGNVIGIHPRALLHYDELEEKEVKEKIDELTKGYEHKPNFYVDKLAEGIATAAAAIYPKPIIVRLSDFKTNEYAELIGGHLFEPEEANPMVGWRGLSRYYDPEFVSSFELECEALKKARDIGLGNIIAMLPFCRTVKEVKRAIKIIGKKGLKRGEDGFEVYLMAEVPSNILLADEFSKVCDGWSIGSNDLTQLTLGVDRDNERLAKTVFDESNEAILRSISHLIKIAHEYGNKVGICGERPSNDPKFTEFLVKEGIDSISVNIDAIGKTREIIAKTEEKLK